MAARSWKGRRADQESALRQGIELFGSENLSTVEHLALVGPNKPLGYVPTDYLSVFFGSRAAAKDWLADLADRRGLVVVERSILTSPIFGGATYVYSPSALTDLLETNADVLIRAGWPKQCDTFVAWTDLVTATDPDVYRVIAEAFADFRPEYRSERNDRLLAERDKARLSGELPQPQQRVSPADLLYAYDRQFRIPSIRRNAVNQNQIPRYTGQAHLRPDLVGTGLYRRSSLPPGVRQSPSAPPNR